MAIEINHVSTVNILTPFSFICICSSCRYRESVIMEVRGKFGRIAKSGVKHGPDTQCSRRQFWDQILIRSYWERERNVLFNDTLNTFYLRLYGIRHMVKDHSDSEKGNPLLPHRLLSPINSKGSFICTIPQTG